MCGGLYQKDPVYEPTREELLCRVEILTKLTNELIKDLAAQKTELTAIKAAQRMLYG